LLVSIVKSKFRVPPVSLARSGPVEIPAGGSTQVSVKTWKRQALNQIQLELRDPPEGVSLDNVKVVPEGLAFRLKADKDTMESGFEDNLIIEAFTQTVQKNTNQKRRTSIGLFPAIPIRIIQ